MVLGLTTIRSKGRPSSMRRVRMNSELAVHTSTWFRKVPIPRCSARLVVIAAEPKALPW